MARARAEGKHVGRRAVVGDVDLDLVARMRGEGRSWAEIHQAHPRTVRTAQQGYRRPSVGTIRRAMACHEGGPRNQGDGTFKT